MFPHVPLLQSELIRILGETEGEIKMTFTTMQFEAITWAMFGIENEIQHLKYLLGTTENEQTEQFLRDQLKRRQEHWNSLRDLIMPLPEFPDKIFVEEK
jgi:hypothetical protein